MDRRLDRASCDGEPTAALFAARLRDEVDLGRIGRDTVAVVSQTVRPAHAVISLRETAR